MEYVYIVYLNNLEILYYTIILEIYSRCQKRGFISDEFFVIFIWSGLLMMVENVKIVASFKKYLSQKIKKKVKETLTQTNNNK